RRALKVKRGFSGINFNFCLC
ncbi:acetyltransferase, partial [Vibrio cholerae]